MLGKLVFPRSSVVGASLYMLTKSYALFRTKIYRQLDKLRENERVVIDTNNEHTFYIGLLAVGRKK